MKKIIYLILFLVLLVLAVTLNVKNDQLVTLSYYFNLEWRAPLALIVTASFVVGLAFGWLFMSLSLLKNKHAVGRANKKLAKVEKEVENLRSMPLKDNI